VVPSEKTRRNRPELKYKKIHLNIKKPHLFIVRVVKHWNRLPREVVESPFLEILKFDWP